MTLFACKIGQVLQIQSFKGAQNWNIKINKAKLCFPSKIIEIHHFFAINKCAQTCTKYISSYFECITPMVTITPFCCRVASCILKVNYLKINICNPLICFNGFQCAWYVAIVWSGYISPIGWESEFCSLLWQEGTLPTTIRSISLRVKQFLDFYCGKLYTGPGA